MLNPDRKDTEKASTCQEKDANIAVTKTTTTPKLLPNSTFPFRKIIYRKKLSTAIEFLKVFFLVDKRVFERIYFVFLNIDEEPISGIQPHLCNTFSAILELETINASPPSAI